MQSLGIAFVFKSRNINIYLKSFIDHHHMHGGLHELSTTPSQNERDGVVCDGMIFTFSTTEKIVVVDNDRKCRTASDNGVFLNPHKNQLPNG